MGVIGLYLTFKDGGEKNVLKMGGQRTRLLLLGGGACALCRGCCRGFTTGLLCFTFTFSLCCLKSPSKSVCDLCPFTLLPLLHVVHVW